LAPGVVPDGAHPAPISNLPWTTATVRRGSTPKHSMRIVTDARSAMDDRSRNYMPGHATAAIVAYPRLRALCARSRRCTVRLVVCTEPIPRDEEARCEFLENVPWRGCCRSFPAKNVHIGGDEDPQGSWQASAHTRERCASGLSRGSNGALFRGSVGRFLFLVRTIGGDRLGRNTRGARSGQ